MIKMSEWIDCLVNLGGLRDFVAGFFKGILTEMGDRVKKIFQQNIQELDGSLEKSLMPFVILNAKSLIFFEETLSRYRKNSQAATANIPNLFIKFWEKFCEAWTESISWARKDQESRNPPKSRASTLYWQYPTIVYHCSRMCALLHQFLLEETAYNLYPFAKLQEKLMVNGLISLASSYHKACDSMISSLSSLLEEQNIDNPASSDSLE